MSNTTNYNLFKYEDNTNADFRLGNPNMDILDTELKKISDKANTKETIIKSITISKSSWTLTSPNLYYMEIRDSDITSNDVVDINISVTNAINNDADSLLSSTISSTGFCRLYCREIPKVDLSATMIIQKGV